MQNKTEYDASDIKVLTGLDLIRGRPGMYIGDADDGTGLANLVLNVVNFYLNELPNNQCSKISIVINENSEVEICATDIELPVHDVDGKSILEKWMTKLTNAKSELFIVNALSSQVLITTTLGGSVWSQSYNNSAAESLKKIAKANYSGTTIRFSPDHQYFNNLYFNRTKITARLKELSYLYEGLSIDFEDRSICESSFSNPRGLADYIVKLIPETSNCKIRIEPVQILDANNSVKLKTILIFSEGYGRQVSFVNDEKSIDGGDHQKGLVAGIAQVFKIITGCKKSAAIWKPIIEQDLISVLSVQITNPQWTGSIKDKLNNKEVFTKTKSLVVKNLLGLIEENEIFKNKFKKLFVNDYLFADYKKNHEKYSLPTSSYAKEMLKKLFTNSGDYEFIVKEYQEFERLSEECLKHQAKDD